jgi:hypothetical protein
MGKKSGTCADLLLLGQKGVLPFPYYFRHWFAWSFYHELIWSYLEGVHFMVVNWYGV